jgi:hypothetical protein
MYFHIETEHARTEPTFHCPVVGCMEKFLTKSLMNRHKKFTHDEKGPNFRPSVIQLKDKICSKLSYFPDELRLHDIEEHKDLLEHRCETCQNGYFMPNLLEAHMETHRSDMEYFECNICCHKVDLKFDRPEELENHIIRVHCVATTLSASKKQKKLQGPNCLNKPKPIKKLVRKFCESCGKLLSGKKVYSHSCGVPESNRFSCELCEDRFYTTEIALVRHTVKFHEGDGNESQRNPEFTCPQCSKVFATSLMFKRHANCHNLEKDLPFHCTLCERRFKDDAQFVKHTNCHNNHELNNKQQDHYLKQCQHCPETFYRVYHLRKHEKLNHPELFVHICSECNASFPELSFLETHLKTHQTTGPYNCTACVTVKAVFISAEKLKAHLEYKHTFGKIIKCPECTFISDNQTSFTQHMASKHGGTWPCICSKCGKGFASEWRLNLHTKAEHDPEEAKKMRVKCNLCEVVVKSKRHLRSHVQQVHENKGLGVCEICGKSVKSMKDHLKMHREEKNHACQFCDKKFVRRDALRMHTYTHTGEKPYVCHICDKGFNQRTPLKRHIELHKKDGSWIPPKPTRTTESDQSESSSSQSQSNSSNPSSTIVKTNGIK